MGGISAHAAFAAASGRQATTVLPSQPLFITRAIFHHRPMCPVSATFPVKCASEQIRKIGCTFKQEGLEHRNAQGREATVAAKDRHADPSASPISQDLDGAALTQSFRCKPEGRTADPCTRKYRVPAGVAIVEGELGVGKIVVAGAGMGGLKRPALNLPGASISEADQVMAVELRWFFERGTPSKITRGGTNHPGKIEPGLLDMPRHSRKRAGAQGKIDAFFGKIDDGIGHANVESDLRMESREFRQKRAEHLARKGDGCADAHYACACDIGLAGRHFAEAARGADCFSSGIEQGFPFFCERLSVRGSMQQLYSSFLFQPRDGARNARRCYADAPCGCVDGSRFHDRNEAAQLKDGYVEIIGNHVLAAPSVDTSGARMRCAHRENHPWQLPKAI